MNNTTTAYNWANLPPEILALIGNRLRTRIDVFRFRSICTSWRSVLPLSHNSVSLSPSVHLPPPFSATARLLPVFLCRLENDTQSASCLIKVTETTSGKMKITSPLSVRDFINKRSPSFTATVNVLNLRLVQLSTGYRLKSKNKTARNLVKKVVSFGHLGILMIYEVGQLVFFGFKEGKLINLGTKDIKYDDIIDYNGQFYVADSMGTVYWVDGKTMNLVQFSPKLFIGYGQMKKLVVSEGEFIVIDSYLNVNGDPGSVSRIVHFQRDNMMVHRLDEEWGNWVKVESLEDRVFVLGNEVCLSVSSKDFPGCRGNCVYFMDSKVEDRRREFKRYFDRVFDLDDRRMKTVDCFPCLRKLFSVSMNFTTTTSSSE